MDSAAAIAERAEQRHRVAELEALLEVKERELTRERERYRELRHRIRNDLQGLTTLLAAQARTSSHPECCSRCILRLRSAAELHNALDDDGSSEISMSAYLRALAEARRKAFEDRIGAVTFFEPDIYLDYRSAQCVGLVYIEATTNAVKHAFPDGAPGHIEARLRRLEEALELTIADDGVGIDPGAIARGDGIDLMRGLAGQLQGDLQLERLPRGTLVRLVFSGVRS